MLRAALVGCGPRGLEHAHALRQLAGITVAGLCDREPAVLAPAIRSLGVPGYDAIGQLLEHTAPHVVIIATPPRQRWNLIQDAVECPGVRAIVIEKPVALSLEEGRTIAAACAARGILGVVCHQLRHAPEFIALKDAIDAGRIGPLDFLRGVCYGNLLNQGIHLIDLMRWLSGSRSVRWVMSQQSNDVPLMARLHQGEQALSRDAAHPAPLWMTHHLAFDGGLRATLETGVLYQRSRRFGGDWLQKRILAVGEVGMAESQAASHCRVLASGHPWQVQPFGLADYQSATRVFYEELLRTLAGQGPHRNDVQEALLSLEAALACQRSAQTGDVCALPLAEAAPASPAASPNVERIRAADAAPQFSVIIPLPDHRGLALECVASFAQQQTLARAGYELILLSDGADPSLDDRVRALLGPGDRLIVHATDNESLLYDLGARHARGRTLLFSEPHCIAEPQCLAELADYLARHDVDGACLRSIGISPNWMARLEEQQYAQGFADFGKDGDWRKVILRGVAIDRAAYLAAGGFEHQFGRFAEWALAARLHSQGRRLGYAAGAAVRHLYTTHVHQLTPHVLDFAAGEIRYRDHETADYCNRYFGEPAAWPGRNASRPEAARALSRAVGRRLLCRREWRDKGRLLRTWVGWKLTAWFGRRPQLWQARWAMRWAMLGCWLRRSQASYGHMYQQIARLGSLQGLHQRDAAIPPALTAAGEFPITALPDEALIGFHALESHDGAPFRWTGPVAALPLALPPGDYELTLDLRQLERCKTWRSLQITLDGRSVSCAIDGSRQKLRCRFTVVAAGKQWLGLTCQPLRPWRLGQPDARELGLPIFGISVVAMESTGPRIMTARMAAPALARPTTERQHHESITASAARHE